LFRFPGYSSHKLLRRFTFSYIFILLIPSIIGLRTYATAKDIVRQDIRHSQLSILNQAKSIIDNQLQQVELLSMEIASDKKVSDMLNLKMPLSNSDYYEFSNSIRDISHYTVNRDFISNLYIYLKNTDYIVTPQTLYSADIYYDKVLKYDMNNYDKWQSAVFSNYFKGKFVTTEIEGNNTNESPNINYIQSLPLTYNQKLSGALVISFRKEVLTDLFSSLDFTEGGWAYIQDADGNIMASVSGSSSPVVSIGQKDLVRDEDLLQKNIDGNDMMISYTTSDYNSWKYVIVLPSSIMLKKLNYFQFINLSLLAGSLIIGILIALFMAYHNSKPVLNIANQLRDFLGDDADKGKDTFTAINGSVSKLINSNKTLQAHIDNQKPLIYDTFLERLLRGQIYIKGEIDAISSYIGINLEGKNFVVLLLRIYLNETADASLYRETIEEINVSKSLVRMLLSNCKDFEYFIHDADNRTIALLVCEAKDSDSSITEETQKVMHEVYTELFNTYNIKIFISGGNICHHPQEVWRSFEQAEHALTHIASKSSGVVWYSNIPKESEAYYYPLDLEQKLINFAKTGDFNQIQKLLQIVFDENFKQRSLSFVTGKELVYEIKSTLLKIISQLSNNDELKKQLQLIDGNNSIDYNFKLAEDIFGVICNIVIDEKSNQNSKFIKKIKEYIDNNYMNQDLCLFKVASHFNLSEGYLSYMFKEQTNINFTDYLESIRMNHASLLLNSTDLSINEISERVGYNSAQSFRRAFKRQCGVNPSSLRGS